MAGRGVGRIAPSCALSAFIVAGCRVVIDAAVETALVRLNAWDHLVGGDDTLQRRIDCLGELDPATRGDLHWVREHGNDALHEAEKPVREELARETLIRTKTVVGMGVCRVVCWVALAAPRVRATRRDTAPSCARDASRAAVVPGASVLQRRPPPRLCGDPRQVLAQRGARSGTALPGPLDTRPALRSSESECRVRNEHWQRRLPRRGARCIEGRIT